MKYLPRVFHYLKPHWGLAICSLLLIVLGSLVGLLTPWPMQILIDNVLGNHPVAESLSFALGSITARPFALLIFVVVGGFLVTVLQNASSVLHNYVNTRLHQSIVLDFRTVLFEHTQRLSMTYHDRRRSGLMIYVINSQGDAVARLIMTVPQMGQSVLTLVGMFWISYTLDPQLALVSLIVIPFIYYSIGYYVTHIQAKLLEVRAMEAESLSIIHEAISMLRVITAFGQERHELTRFRKQGEQTVDARVKLTVRQTLFSFVVNSTTAAGTALVLGLGAYHVMQGRVTVGQLLVVMSYIASVYKPLEAISATIGALQEILVSLQMAFDVLDTQPEIQDKAGAQVVKHVEGKVVFENVTFSYEGRKDALTNISFEAEPGRVIAVVGQTGAGKTTMISLLPRFYLPREGRILLDDKDISDFTLQSLRGHISIVLQDPLLFSMSISDNIRYGRMNATQDEIIEAAKSANAHDFIMKLPKQYNTELGERGSQLSTGERQRISVARAFLKNAPILILDEPTSSIDSKTEIVILDALDRLMVGRTTFIIAHRLSTIRYSDMILVLNEGHLVEQGTHSELIAARGMYYQLHEVQNSQRKSKRIAAAESAQFASPEPA